MAAEYVKDEAELDALLADESVVVVDCTASLGVAPVSW